MSVQWKTVIAYIIILLTVVIVISSFFTIQKTTMIDGRYTGGNCSSSITGYSNFTFSHSFFLKPCLTDNIKIDVLFTLYSNDVYSLEQDKDVIIIVNILGATVVLILLVLSNYLMKFTIGKSRRIIRILLIVLFGCFLIKHIFFPYYAKLILGNTVLSNNLTRVDGSLGKMESRLNYLRLLTANDRFLYYKYDDCLSLFKGEFHYSQNEKSNSEPSYWGDTWNCRYNGKLMIDQIFASYKTHPMQLQAILFNSYISEMVTLCHGSDLANCCEVLKRENDYLNDVNRSANEINHLKEINRIGKNISKIKTLCATRTRGIK